MLNSSKVRLALGYVRGANHQPSWVLPNAYKEVAKGNIHSGTVSRGTHLGAMSYGRYAVRVVKDTIYRGLYKRLPIFYVVSKSVTTKTIGGVKYRVTTSYWVSMAKPCGNVFIFHKRVTKVKVPPEKHAVFVKKINADTGEQLANWLISGGGKSVTTLASGWVKLGDFEKGNHFPVSEELKFGWMSVSPLNGVFPDVMIGDEDVYLTFSNKPIPTPTPTPTPIPTPTPTPTPTCTGTPPPPPPPPPPTPTPTPTPTPSCTGTPPPPPPPPPDLSWLERMVSIF
ncbi:MAG: hypothetical protein PHU86_00310 [Patescibacteria group bacterium]|nr:hypothetical protein [Patescibacteria group bacterium]